MSSQPSASRPEPPRWLWHVFALLEDLAWAGLDNDAIDDEIIRTWISGYPVNEASQIVQCFEIVAVVLDYVKALLAASVERDSVRTVVPPPPLPTESGAWRQRVAAIARAREAHTDEHGSRIAEPITAMTDPETRWCLRHALGLTESALATIGHHADVTRDTVTARCRFLTARERLRTLATMTSLEAILGYALLHLSP